MAPQTDTPRTLAEKVWDRHVVHRADGEPDILYVDLHLVHEVTSPQAFESLRLHGRPVRRPDLTVATMDHNVPTTPGPVTDPISARQMEALATNAKDFGVTLLSHGLARPGHRPRDRSRAGLHAARAGHRLRRLAHLHARRVRRARVRHRHQRGRARPRHPDPAAEPSRHDGRHRRGRPARCVQRQGHHPGDHQPHRDGRRRRPHHRVPRLRDPRALHGGPHDDLQHVDRGRRARRHGGARRHHLRLRRGPSPRAAGRRLGAALDDWRTLPTDDGATFDKRGRDRRLSAASVRELGHQPRAVRHDRRRRARPRQPSRTRPSARPPRAPSRTWTSRPARRCARSAPTRSSSARARTRAWRTCAWPPSVVGGKKRRRRPARARRPRQRSPSSRRPKPRGSTASSSDAGLRVARRRLQHVPGHEPRHAEPRRPQRQHQQPQLRRAPGQGRAHAPGESRPSPPPPRSRATSATPEREAQLMEPVTVIEGTALPVDRSDVDTDQIIPAEYLKRIERTGLRAVPVRRVAQGSRLRDQRSAVRGRLDHDRGRELRLRLQPRARAVGDRGRRVQGGDRAELRRHLPQQLHEDRPAAGGAPRRVACAR